MTTALQHDNVILFDGVCNLCNGFVQFIIKRDTKKKFRFASLQSDAAKDLIEKHHLDSFQLKTVIFIQCNIVYTQSSAVLHIAKALGGFWKLLYVGIIVPKSIRDYLYKFVSKKRYEWFGKSATCMMPTAELQERFL
jgi:predicted DCC family thiol-disulfide oxidoreductase YuxK